MQMLLESLYFPLIFFIGMLLFLELGRRLGKRHRALDPDGADKGTGAVDAAVFALFGLLLAFTFSSAAARFDHRRDLIVQEANAIGTAYLRVDLLPLDTQPPLRALFRQYVAARRASYRALTGALEQQPEYRHNVALQTAIWQRAVTAANAADKPTVVGLVLTPLNEMIDITTTRLAASHAHPPQIVFMMLFGLTMAVSLLVGYGTAFSRTRHWFHTLAFALTMTTTVYVIVDLEYPRFGFIRIDASDRYLVDLLQGMQ